MPGSNHTTRDVRYARTKDAQSASREDDVVTSPSRWRALSTIVRIFSDTVNPGEGVLDMIKSSVLQNPMVPASTQMLGRYTKGTSSRKSVDTENAAHAVKSRDVPLISTPNNVPDEGSNRTQDMARNQAACPRVSPLASEEVRDTSSCKDSNNTKKSSPLSASSSFGPLVFMREAIKTQLSSLMDYAVDASSLFLSPETFNKLGLRRRHLTGGMHAIKSGEPVTGVRNPPAISECRGTLNMQKTDSSSTHNIGELQDKCIKVSMRKATPKNIQNGGVLHVVDEKKLLKVLENFNFEEALRASYANESNVDGAQFLTDLTRCHWLLNGKSYKTSQMEEVLKSCEKTHLFQSAGPGLLEVANTNYRTWWTDFRRDYPDRYTSLSALYKVLSQGNVAGPSLLLVDEIVTHCHQGGLSASMYLETMLQIADALNTATYSAGGGNRNLFEKKEIMPLLPRFKDLRRNVDVVSENKFSITEDLSFVITAGGHASHMEHRVSTSLRFEISKGKGGSVRFSNCSVRATITSPPGVKISGDGDIGWWTKLKIWFIRLYRAICEMFCGSKALRSDASGHVTKTNTLLSLEKKQNSEGETVLDFAYSIPSVTTKPHGLLCPRFSNNALVANIVADPSQPQRKPWVHTNDSSSDHRRRSPSEHCRSQQEASTKRKRATRVEQSEMSPPVVEAVENATIAPFSSPSANMRV